MSTTLKDILGAILSDTIRAQHEVNFMLKNVSEQYEKDGRLSGIKMPSASIGQLQLSLKYAVTGGVEQLQEEDSDQKEVFKVLRYIAFESSELLVKTFVSSIQNSSVDYKDRFGFVDNLTNNKEFIMHFAKRLFGLFSNARSRLLDAEFNLIESEIYKIIYKAAIENILDHEDVRSLFYLDSEDSLHPFIETEFERVLHKELDDILRESKMPSFRRIQRYGSLDVEISEQELSKLPESCIHTMTITIVPPDEVSVQTNNR